MRISELPDIYCLGLKALGPCQYDLAQPSLTFFSIGQLATVVSLILTFSQLARPILKFRLSTRATPRWTPWIGIGVAILCVFVAAGLRLRPMPGIPVFGYPIVWEYLGGLAFVIASLAMVFRVSTAVALSRRNGLRYLQGSRNIIARGNAEDLREFGEEIDRSVDLVVRTCAEHARRVLVAHPTVPPPTEFERVCYTLLDLWADPQLCKVLVTRCPATAISIMLAVREHRLFESGARALVHRLIDNAFAETSSISHREGEYSGLGRARSFMNATFSDTEFVASRLRPLEAWAIFLDSKMSEAKVQRYGDAIKIAFDGAAGEHKLGRAVVPWYLALKEVAGIAQRGAWALMRMTKDEVQQSDWPGIIHECEKILAKAVESVAALQPQPEQGEVDIDVASYKNMNDRTLYGYLARALFEFFESLATCREHQDTVRLYALDLWGEIFPPHRRAIEPALRAIQHRFLFLMREKIDENTNLPQLYYPLVTRLMITMWGLPDSPTAEVAPMRDPARGENDFYIYVFSAIKNKYLAIREVNKEFAEHLLPEAVEFIEDPPSLRQTYLRGYFATFALNRPQKQVVEWSQSQ
jgi:hypothetical protein